MWQSCEKGWEETPVERKPDLHNTTTIFCRLSVYCERAWQCGRMCMRSEGYGSCPVCVCVCVCPRPSSATRATKRQTRHTGGLSIVLASV